MNTDLYSLYDSLHSAPVLHVDTERRSADSARTADLAAPLIDLSVAAAQTLTSVAQVPRYVVDEKSCVVNVYHIIQYIPFASWTRTCCAVDISHRMA